MKKELKGGYIEKLTELLNANNTLYLADIGDLNAQQTADLRRLCFKNEVKVQVVKNALLKKAMKESSINYEELEKVLKGHTAIMTAEVNNAPAKLIKEARKTGDKPILKAAYVEECFYIGDNQLDYLCNIKSKNELIGEIVGLLQSPIKNVVSALQSGGNTIHGVLKTLSERPE
ncbi:MAG: 50S ribosomal protein L10 [Bacteroidales bacterium]|jgi:large subunit ribosomal protein L10|nr:50S ribosomal protein L10 [Bacteroidales bacterium]MBR5651286.1 50S ribosomal protein L10 [Bacteroidales bacterium]